MSNVAFLYWGRRGFSRFTLEAAHAAREMGLNAYFSVSTANDLYGDFRELGDRVLAVDTFRSNAGAALKAAHVLALRRRVGRWLSERRIDSVVNLMPHVWSPLVSGALRRPGVRYSVIMHDARPHPGDRARLIFNWLLSDARAADTVVTLSGFVRNELVRRAGLAADRVKTVLMPDLVFSRPPAHDAVKARRRPGTPLRILYFGRLLQYKGLEMFADSMEILAARGVPIEISVCGEGYLGEVSPRLARLGAVVVNRWLTDGEIGQLLACHDAVVLTHIEASQSGAISAAIGANLPVVTTPVGGLVEQVAPRGAGLVAARITADAIADCVQRLALDHALYNDIVDRIGSSVPFSMTRFLRELLVATAAHHSAAPHAVVAAGEPLPQLVAVP